MIIGLTGLKGSGKDTVAAYLIKQHGFERRAFADPLKKSVAALLKIPYHEVDIMKNDNAIEISLEAPMPDSLGVVSRFTFREFLQRYGTEAHRDVFGEDFWVDHCLPMGHYYPNKKIAITDVRFESEAKRVRLLEGSIVYVDRPGLGTEDQHRSEAGLPGKYIDYVLVNDGSIDTLDVRIELMLDDLLSKVA